MPNTFHFTEDSYEQSIISLFKEMGYEYHYGPELETDTCRELTDATIPGALRKAMLLINGTDKVGAVDEAIRQIRELFSQPLVSANVTLTDWLQNGLDVTFKTDQGTLRSDHIKIIDPVNIDNNSFVVANQWTIVNGNSTKRADIVVFVNGLPVSVIELKSPSREVTNSEEAHQQLQNYMRIVPQLFTACQMLVISDMADTRVGTITAPLDRYMEWKTTDGSYESTVFADFETFFNGIFTKHRFIDIIADFTLTMGVDKKLRILAGYHQYFAVKKALDCTKQALQRNDGKIGVFWHTQGSGKSLSMVFYAHQLLKNLLSATLLVLTDRLDLNDQLHNTFAACSDYLRQTPIKATDGEHLYELLEKRKSHGVIFANIQKFKDRDKLITNRSDVIVISDEAHRTQSNTKTKVDTETGELKLGFAAIVRKLLPHAAFIGFTGTPIEQDDNDTREVFGNYIDIYDMTQAVEDGATVPVYYESRLLKLDLDADTLKLLDNEYEKLAEEGAEEQDIKRSKDENARLHALLSAPQTIDSLCKDIIDHYENNRADLLTGKAMIVAIDRATGIDIYKKLIELRPQWKDIICVVMTQGNQDPVEWNDIIGSGARKEELARQFKDNNSPLKIAIVVDMWLTGFDVPSLATMYVYKPMQGHNLMQAIARVNRVFKDKEGGLIVDYIGIATALKAAMNDYTSRDKKNYGDTDVAKVAYPKFLEKLSICRDLFHGYDYSKFIVGSDLDRSKAISGAVNFIVAVDKEIERESFLKEALMLRQALSLCSSLVEKQLRIEAAFFESVRVLLMRLMNKGDGKKISLHEMNERINELLKQSIKSDGVINLFSDISQEFSLFDPKFLLEIAKMKGKNIAVELLKKLIAEQVQVYRRTNVVKSEKFSEIIQSVMNRYLNGMLTNEQVIEELLNLAKQIAAAKEEGQQLGLTADELAFYDALTKPQAIKDFYENEELIAITKELADTLRKNKTVDWQKRDSARAKMRMLIKKLLKRHKYPPEGMDDAVQTVMTQCELWTDTNDMRENEDDKGYRVDMSDKLLMVAEKQENGYGIKI